MKYDINYQVIIAPIVQPVGINATIFKFKSLDWMKLLGDIPNQIILHVYVGS